MDYRGANAPKVSAFPISGTVRFWYCWLPRAYTNTGDEKSSFLVDIRFFYDNISKIVYNKTINCPRHDLKSFSVCDMNFKFLNTMILRCNTRFCACVRFKHASYTRKNCPAPMWENVRKLHHTPYNL